MSFVVCCLFYVAGDDCDTTCRDYTRLQHYGRDEGGDVSGDVCDCDSHDPDHRLGRHRMMSMVMLPRMTMCKEVLIASRKNTQYVHSAHAGTAGGVIASRAWRVKSSRAWDITNCIQDDLIEVASARLVGKTELKVEATVMSLAGHGCRILETLSAAGCSSVRGSRGCHSILSGRILNPVDLGRLGEYIGVVGSSFRRGGGVLLYYCHQTVRLWEILSQQRTPNRRWFGIGRVNTFFIHCLYFYH